MKRHIPGDRPAGRTGIVRIIHAPDETTAIYKPEDTSPAAATIKDFRKSVVKHFNFPGLEIS